MAAKLLHTAGSFTGLASSRSNSFTTGASLSQGEHAKKRLPTSEELFHEGYVLRRTTALRVLNKWVRQFCILQQGMCMFHSNWTTLMDDTPPLFSFTLDAHVVVKSGQTPCTLVLESPNFAQAVFLAFDSLSDCVEWKSFFLLEIKRQAGEVEQFPRVRSRFFEGYLFKTPPEADKWEERWFELNSRGELHYSAGFGQKEKGMIDLETCKIYPNTTEAKGICTPYYFQIHTFELLPDGSFRKRVFNLSAPTQLEYLNWLKALKVWMGVKRPDVFVFPAPGVDSKNLLEEEEEGMAKHENYNA